MKTKKKEMKTMTEIIQKLAKKGYSTNFGELDGVIADMGERKTYKPEDLKILKVYRFEGESDPDDMSVMYVLKANDGKKGTYVEAFGPIGNDSIDIINFMKEVPEEFRESL